MTKRNREVNMKEEHLPTRLHLHTMKDYAPMVLYRLHSLESQHSWAYGPSAWQQAELKKHNLEVPLVRIKKDKAR